MKLDEAQTKKVIDWIEAGLKVSEIQDRLDRELGMRLTYMDVRLLLDDLRLTPKNQPAPPTPNLPEPTPSAAKAKPENQPLSLGDPLEDDPPAGSPVKLTVDTVTQPGALVSGGVTFSDGQTATWYLDQMGRLGLAAKKPGYRPSPADLEDFQIELQTELQKLGY